MSRAALAELGRELATDPIYGSAVETWPSPIAYELSTLRRLIDRPTAEIDAPSVLLQTRDVAEVILNLPLLLLAADLLSVRIAAKSATAWAQALLTGSAEAEKTWSLAAEMLTLARMRDPHASSLAALAQPIEAALPQGAGDDLAEDERGLAGGFLRRLFRRLQGG